MKNQLFKSYIKTYEPIIERVRGRLKPNRFKHTMGVAEEAVDMALKYGTDPEAMFLCAIFHDYAKHLPHNDLVQMADELGVESDFVMDHAPSLLHGHVSAEMARRDFDLNDETLLNAIRWHTVGRVGMTLEDKIIYLADAIEPYRDYPGVDEMRTAAEESLEKAILLSVNSTIKYVIESGGLIHPNSIAMRNEIIFNLKTEDE